MQIETLKYWYTLQKETALSGRYITNAVLVPLLEKIKANATVTVIGKSVKADNIYALKIGNGKKKILIWSQMHGNESTCTKALFDVLNVLQQNNTISREILTACTLQIIPILNPDGAKAYTRLNANKVDLNRDAQNLSQPETKVLLECFKSFQPDYCFNLHDQRTIFGAGNTNNPAIVSFLAPAQDEKCTITWNRKKAMELIAAMNQQLQKQIPNKIGVYDDSFNLNCVGDTFQNYGVPTILFEAGHHKTDYDREQVREYIFQSLFVAIEYIANNEVTGEAYKAYFNIPENRKCFYDILIRNVKHKSNIIDIAIQYEEKLLDENIVFIPKVVAMEALPNFFSHKTIDAKANEVFNSNIQELEIGETVEKVVINLEEYSLKLTKS